MLPQIHLTKIKFFHIVSIRYFAIFIINLAENIVGICINSFLGM